MSIREERLDVLVFGGEPERRRRPAVVALVLAVALIAGASYSLDHRSRQGEYEALTRCARTASDALDDVMSRISREAEYVRPALALAPDATRRGLYAMIARQAGDAGPGPVRARATCAAVHVQAWHGPQRRARAVELEYVDSELDLFARVAGNGRAYFADRRRVDDLEDAAGLAVAAAEPSLL